MTDLLILAMVVFLIANVLVIWAMVRAMQRLDGAVREVSANVATSLEAKASKSIQYTDHAECASCHGPIGEHPMKVTGRVELTPGLRVPVSMEVCQNCAQQVAGPVGAMSIGFDSEQAYGR